jgi:hypothetical protein
MTISGTRRTFAGLVLLGAVSWGAAPALHHGGAVARADQQASASYVAQPSDGSQDASGSGSPCQGSTTGSGSGSGTGSSTGSSTATGSGSGTGTNTNTNCCPGPNNTNWG